MKSFKKYLLIAISFLFINLATSIQNAFILTLSKDFKVTIHGTSNLHEWDEKVGIVLGNGVGNWNSDGTFDLDSINLSMNVHSIKSDMGSVMDHNTHMALKADTNPEIIFKLKVPVKSIQTNSNQKNISAKGILTIAGVTRSVDMQVNVFMQEHGKLAFDGLHTIKMTDYGVDPPTTLFGTIKTGNEITINFKISFTIMNN